MYSFFCLCKVRQVPDKNLFFPDSSHPASSKPLAETGYMTRRHYL
jgi:hypothetical protein